MKIMKITAALLTAACLAAAPVSAYAAEAPDVETEAVYVDTVYPNFNELDVNGTFGMRMLSGASVHVDITFDSPENETEPYYTYDITDSKIYAFKAEGRDNTEDDYRYYDLTLTAKNEDGTESKPYTGRFTISDPNDNPDSFVMYTFVINVDDDISSGEDVTVVKEDSSKVENITVIGYNLTFHIASYVLGDVDGNGLIDSADASAVLVENAETTNGSGSFTDVQKKAADINGDGLIDSADASLILAYNSYKAGSGELSIAEWYESGE